MLCVNVAIIQKYNIKGNYVDIILYKTALFYDLLNHFFSTRISTPLYILNAKFLKIKDLKNYSKNRNFISVIQEKI